MVVERVSGVTRESASPRVQTGSGRKPLSLAWHEPGGAGEPVVIAIEPAPGEVVELVGGEHPTNPRTTMTSRVWAHQRRAWATRTATRTRKAATLSSPASMPTMGRNRNHASRSGSVRIAARAVN
jgi:hypothetical protein